MENENIEAGACELLDFTYRPKTRVREGRLVMLGLLIISALLVIASVISPKYKGVISLFAVFALVGVIFVYTRYLAPQYAYAVMTSGEGEALLVVTKNVGKSLSTLAMIRLYEITDVTPVLSEGDKEPLRGERKYNFCPSMKPEQIWAVRSADRYEKRLFLLEVNEQVAKRISDYAKLAKETEPDE